MENTKKKLLYIHPSTMPYYEIYDYLTFANDAYIICDISLKQKFKAFKYLNANYSNKLNLVTKFLENVANLEQIISNLNPQFVITKEIFLPLSYRITKLMKKVRYNHIIYCDDTVSMDKSLWGISPFNRYYAKYNLRNENYYIATSSLSLRMLLKMGVEESKIRLIRNSIYTHTYKESILKDECKDLLFIGNLEHNKGIITMVKAIKFLNSNVRLHIAGRGSLAPFIANIANKQKNVIFHGYISESEKRNLLSSCDIFLYPSEDIVMPFHRIRWEEQGAISVIEAMASGLPVIGSNSGALPEILGENLKARQLDSLDLAEKINELCNDPNKRRYLHNYNIKRSRSEFDLFLNGLKFSKFISIID